MENSEQKKLEELAKDKGQKLAFFLSQSKMPQEQKEAWLALLPEMSLEQVEELLDILEAQHLSQETGQTDSDFKKNLTAIESEYQEKQADLDNDTIEKMKKLTDNL
ncbi:MAG: hypothetical protein PHO91_00790 [Patescibacteria group bacterium]|nr:hypothetical protein [Patescibacteria group bacterium]